MSKINLWKTTFIDLGARKPKVSNANGIKTCWLSDHAFSCLTILLEAALRDSRPTVKSSTLSPTNKKTIVNIQTVLRSAHSKQGFTCKKIGAADPTCLIYF
jgi:hypothetical protein